MCDVMSTVTFCRMLREDCTTFSKKMCQKLTLGAPAACLDDEDHLQNQVWPFPTIILLFHQLSVIKQFVRQSCHLKY